MKPAVSQETDRISSRRIVGITAVSILAGVFGIAFSRFLDLPRNHRTPENAPSTIGMLEQSSIESSERGISLRREQEASLHRYRWLDRDAGVAEIPIERAMQIVEERAQ